MRTQSESLDRKNESQSVCKIISVRNMQVFRERLAFCEILWLNTFLHKSRKNSTGQEEEDTNLYLRIILFHAWNGFDDLSNVYMLVSLH